MSTFPDTPACEAGRGRGRGGDLPEPPYPASDRERWRNIEVGREREYVPESSAHFYDLIWL